MRRVRAADAVYGGGDKIAAAKDRVFSVIKNARLKYPEDMDEAERRLLAAW